MVIKMGITKTNISTTFNNEHNTKHKTEGDNRQLILYLKFSNSSYLALNLGEISNMRVCSNVKHWINRISVKWRWLNNDMKRHLVVVTLTIY